MKIILKEKTILLKVSGSILGADLHKECLAQDIQCLLDKGAKVILVHGGGKEITQEMRKKNIESKFIEGLRVTDHAMMNIIETLMCGKINTNLVRILNQKNISSIGLNGLDMSLLQCDYYDKSLGLVGKIKKVNSEILSLLIDNQALDNVVPVVASVGIDDDGNAVNVNADESAAAIAMALGVDYLFFITDQDGILDNNNNVQKILNIQDMQNLIDEKIVSDGMLVKAKSIINLLSSGIKKINIVNGKRYRSISDSLFMKDFPFTSCMNN